MHMCLTVSGRQRRLSHGPPDSSIPCNAGTTTRSRIRVGTGKGRIAPQCRIAEHGVVD